MQKRMPINLTDDQKKNFIEFNSSLVNYESTDPNESIDPLSYIDSCGDNCLHIAAFRGNEEVVKILINLGLSINSAGDKECTPLHYAAMNGNLNIVKELLAHGADPELNNWFRQTALMIAETKGHSEIVGFLKNSSSV